VGDVSAPPPSSLWQGLLTGRRGVETRRPPGRAQAATAVGGPVQVATRPSTPHTPSRTVPPPAIPCHATVSPVIGPATAAASRQQRRGRRVCRPRLLAMLVPWGPRVRLTADSLDRTGCLPALAAVGRGTRGVWGRTDRRCPSEDLSSALTKSSNAARWFPHGRPVGPNLQLNAKPLGSVGAQRGPTEPPDSPFSSVFSSPFARDGHMSNTIETRQGHIKDNKVYMTFRQLLATTLKARNEVDLVPHWLHFPVQRTARSAADGATAIRWAFRSLMQQEWADLTLVYQVFKVTSGDPEDAARQYRTSTGIAGAWTALAAGGLHHFCCWHDHKKVPVQAN